MRQSSNIFVLLLSLLMTACGFFSGRQEDHIRGATEAVLRNKAHFLLKDSSLSDYFYIGKKGLELYASPEDKKARVAEASFSWEEIENLHNALPTMTDSAFKEIYRLKTETIGYAFLTPPVPRIHRQPAAKKEGKGKLAGLRIAIDPGHVGGDMLMGELEQKYVKVKRPEGDIAFNEGSITMATALFLKELLEESGAKVMITRPKNGASAFGMPYFDWLKDDFEKKVFNALDSGRIALDKAKFLMEEADSVQRFHSFFKNEELEQRAKLINAFHPDLTVIIHYNVDSPNWEGRDEDGFHKQTDRNYNMAFVPGSFMKNELEDRADRTAFARLLICDDLYWSMVLAGQTVVAYSDELNVRPIPRRNDLMYLEKGCIPIGDAGVYARNLSLTRLVKGPLVFGETFCQENVEESIRLNTKDDEINGIPVPSRTREVAGAYFDGILNYHKKRQGHLVK